RVGDVDRLVARSGRRALPPQDLRRRIDGDPVDSAVQAGFAAVLPALAPGGHQRFLDRVFGQPGLARDAQARRVPAAGAPGDRGVEVLKAWLGHGRHRDEHDAWMTAGAAWLAWRADRPP